MPHLPDMLLSRDEVLEGIADLAVRFEHVDTPDGRKNLANLFERWDQALRLAPGPDGRRPLHPILLEDHPSGNMMHGLCVFLLRTGLLRDRYERADLAECLVHLVEMFISPHLPDELWDRHLDDRAVHPSNRLRALSKLLPEEVTP